MEEKNIKNIRDELMREFNNLTSDELRELWELWQQRVNCGGDNS